MPYSNRTLEPIVLRAARELPAVLLTGPCESGETTLLNHPLGKSHHYVSLEFPDIQGAALCHSMERINAIVLKIVKPPFREPNHPQPSL